MDFYSSFSANLSGQGPTQLYQLLLAFVLSSLIGLERETKLKSAGLRTHTLVGVGAALMMLVSKYGFYDVLHLENVTLDPARVAAQIVSGIGFIGGGLIFVRRDIVHGLTTAAVVWLTAGIGMACGGGLPLLAIAATVGHFTVTLGYTKIMAKVAGNTNRLHIRYRPGYDAVAKVLALCEAQEFTALSFTVQTLSTPEEICAEEACVDLRVRGRSAISVLVGALSKLPEIVSVTVNPHEEGE